MDGEGSFPRTRHSVLERARSADASERRLAHETLANAYWKPVYKYLRLCRHADAETAADWTQEFFARALEQQTFERFDATRARLRTYLRVCLDGFVANRLAEAGREKRGGGARVLSLDFAAAEGELAPLGAVGALPRSPEDLDAYFHREWMRSLFEGALGDLRAQLETEGKGRDFALFERCDLDRVDGGSRSSYAELANEFELTLGQVASRLHAVRARLRRHVLARLSGLCASDEEFRAEARALFGGDAGGGTT